MVSGVIAEFNIFHNGHKYLIDKVREKSDAVVAVMSGSFVQRGDVAIKDKWSRAQAALVNGVDLVLELPVCYALNAAQNFASGGVSTLNTLGIVDNLIFGSESGDTETLTRAAGILESDSRSEVLKTYLSDGLSYPAALEKAYEGKIDGGLIGQPNNILAVEYIRAIMRSGSGIKPISVKRHETGHNDNSIKGSFASASKIREMMIDGEDISSLIPSNFQNGSGIRTLSCLEAAIMANLRTIGVSELANISEVAEGLENRIKKAAMESGSFAELAEKVKSKRYTMSKIRRILISSLLGFTKDIYSPEPEYIRVLGMNSTGAALLKAAKNTCSVPIITKTADYRGESRQLALDIRATDIAALCADNTNERKGGADFTHSPVIVNGG